MSQPAVFRWGKLPDGRGGWTDFGLGDAVGIGRSEAERLGHWIGEQAHRLMTRRQPAGFWLIREADGTTLLVVFSGTITCGSRDGWHCTVARWDHPPEHPFAQALALPLEPPQSLQRVAAPSAEAVARARAVWQGERPVRVALPVGVPLEEVAAAFWGVIDGPCKLALGTAAPPDRGFDVAVARDATVHASRPVPTTSGHRGPAPGDGEGPHREPLGAPRRTVSNRHVPEPVDEVVSPWWRRSPLPLALAAMFSVVFVPQLFENTHEFDLEVLGGPRWPQTAEWVATPAPQPVSASPDAPPSAPRRAQAPVPAAIRVAPVSVGTVRNPGGDVEALAAQAKRALEAAQKKQKEAEAAEAERRRAQEQAEDEAEAEADKKAEAEKKAADEARRAAEKPKQVARESAKPDARRARPSPVARVEAPPATSEPAIGTAGAPGARPDGARPDGARPDGARPDGARPDVARTTPAEGGNVEAHPRRTHFEVTLHEYTMEDGKYWLEGCGHTISERPLADLVGHSRICEAGGGRLTISLGGHPGRQISMNFKGVEEHSTKHFTIRAETR